MRRGKTDQGAASGSIYAGADEKSNDCRWHGSCSHFHEEVVMRTRTEIGSLVPLVLVPLALTLSGCRVIEGIFKAGVWVGVIAVLFVVALVFGISRAFMR